MNLKKLAIVTSHPIQYNAPLFRLLTERGKIAIKVFYTLEKKAVAFDRDFGKEIEWDLPLLEGYTYTFVSNNGSDRKDFWGVKNPGLEKEIEDWEADAVMVYGWNYYSHLRAMRYFKKRKKVIFRGDSTLLDDNPGMKSFLRKSFLKWIYSHIDIALYTGQNNRAYYKACGLADKKLIPAPHAVDNERFRIQSENNREKAISIRKEFFIPSDAIVLLFAGKFQEKKNPLFLLKTFLQLKAKDLHILFIGDGALKEKLADLAVGKANVHIQPFRNQSEMPVIYQLCDIYCLPSRGPGETWGLAVNEAMACSKAVLVSDKVGCAPDLVVNGQNGYIFKSNDEEDLQSKILQMLDKNLLLSMGAKSFERIQYFSLEGIARQIEELI